MKILDSILRRREPVAAYRTIDGGHSAPYPDMTDEQLYNYEVAFNVPVRTFDKPPSSSRAVRHEAKAQESDKVDEQPLSSADTVRNDSELQASDKACEPAPPEVQEHVLEPSEPSRPSDRVPLDFTKPMRTVTTKQPVDIITTRARHPVYKVHGYIDNADVVTVFTLEGQLSENGPRFLENVPEQRELHLNIYRNHDICSEERYIVTQHESREDADSAATAGRIACVRAEFDV